MAPVATPMTVPTAATAASARRADDSSLSRASGPDRGSGGDGVDSAADIEVLVEMGPVERAGVGAGARPAPQLVGLGVLRVEPVAAGPPLEPVAIRAPGQVVAAAPAPHPVALGRAAQAVGAVEPVGEAERARGS